ncbi:MAG: HD-GYP domain-containing protein [Acidobacteriota bacterium]
MSETRPSARDHAEAQEPSCSLTIDELGLTSTVELEGKELGSKDFLFAWFQLFRTAQIHAIGNDALRRSVENFIAVSSGFLSREGAVSLQAKDGILFLNSAKLTLTSDEYHGTAEPLFDFFADRGIGGFVVEHPFDVETVRKLLQILVYSPPEELKFDRIQTKLIEAGVPFRINRPLGVRKTDAEAVLERRAYTFLTYSKLVVLYRPLLTEEEISPAKRFALVKKIGRTVEALVDICNEDDHTFLDVSSVKSGDAYHLHHMANVTVLAIALGEKLGLGKVALADLGMAAALKDIGLRKVPANILEKGDGLEPGERAVLDRHTHHGVFFHLEEKRYTKSLLHRILVAFEHHRRVDGGGYPRLCHPMNLFSRIVAIAEAYDAMTTNRPGRKAYLPDEALGLMLAESGKAFDPLLLKVFANTVGLYPVGTLVRLTTGEMGVVVFSGGQEERITHPIVALLGPDGKPSQSVDLAEKDASGKYLREIASSEDPTKYGLQPSGLLSASRVS